MRPCLETQQRQYFRLQASEGVCPPNTEQDSHTLPSEVKSKIARMVAAEFTARCGLCT